MVVLVLVLSDPYCWLIWTRDRRSSVEICLAEIMSRDSKPTAGDACVCVCMCVCVYREEGEVGDGDGGFEPSITYRDRRSALSRLRMERVVRRTVFTNKAGRELRRVMMILPWSSGR